MRTDRSTIALVSLAAAAVLCASAAPARAASPQEPAAKQALADGDRNFQLGRYEDAIGAYERAYGLDPQPAFLYNIALAHRRQYDVDGRLDHLLRARELYRNYLKSNAAGPRRVGVEKILADLDAKITEAKGGDAKGGEAKGAALESTDARARDATTPAPATDADARLAAAPRLTTDASPTGAATSTTGASPVATGAFTSPHLLEAPPPGGASSPLVDSAPPPKSHAGWYIAGGAVAVAAGVVLTVVLVSRSNHTSFDGPAIDLSPH